MLLDIVQSNFCDGYRDTVVNQQKFKTQVISGEGIQQPSQDYFIA